MSGCYLEIYKGDDYTFITNVTVDDVAQNISGSYLWFMAKGSFEDDDNEAIINVNSNSGAISVNNSTVTLTMNSAFTGDLPITNVAAWRLRMQTQAGKVYTLDRGQLAIVHGWPDPN